MTVTRYVTGTERRRNGDTSIRCLRFAGAAMREAFFTQKHASFRNRRASGPF